MFGFGSNSNKSKRQRYSHYSKKNSGAYRKLQKAKSTRAKSKKKHTAKVAKRAMKTWSGNKRKKRGLFG